MHPRFVKPAFGWCALAAIGLVGCVDLGELASGGRPGAQDPPDPGCGVDCASPSDSSPPDMLRPAPPVCEGAACAGRVTVLSAAEQQPHDLFVGGGHVYWVSSEARVVRSVAARGGAVMTIDATAGEYRPSSVYADDTHIYWTESFRRPNDTDTTARVRRAGRNGSPSSYAQLLHPKGNVDRVPLGGDADRLYTCARYSTTTTLPYADIMMLGISKPAASATTSTIGEIATLSAQATRIVLGSTFVFSSEGSTLRALGIVGATEKEYDIGGEIGGVATRGNIAFVTVPALHAVKRVDATAVPSSIFTVASGLSTPSAIAADATTVVWVSDGRVVNALAAAAGAAPDEIARTESPISSIAMDADAIYLATATSIIRVAR